MTIRELSEKKSLKTPIYTISGHTVSCIFKGYRDQYMLEHIYLDDLTDDCSFPFKTIIALINEFDMWNEEIISEKQWRKYNKALTVKGIN